MTHILPTTPHASSGGQPAHISQSGWPLCGARMPETYILSEHLMSWNLCPTCQHIAQAGLFGDSTDDTDGVADGAGVRVW